MDRVNLKFDQLLVFVTAARERSFSATARTLGKAQSAVSTAISGLEIDLGVDLFDRSGRYPTLTSAGESMLAEAEAILSHCESLKDRANALSGQLEPRISIVIEDAFPCGEIAPVLRELRQRFPAVMVDVLQPCTSDLLDMVVNGAAMLGLGCVRDHYPPGIGFSRLGHVTMVNAARHDHPLARLRSIRFAQLADHLHLLVHTQSSHLLTSEYLKSPRRWCVQSEMALLELLKSGLGWAMVPKRLIAAELASGELVELRLKAYPFTQWTVGLDLTWRTDTRPGAISTWLKGELSRTSVFA